jgi:inorganic pyrophosphatase
VLTDEAAFPGCVLKCRAIGPIEGEQEEGGNIQKNDRVIAIERLAHSWSDVRQLSDLGKQFRNELEEFFVQYNKLAGK